MIEKVLSKIFKGTCFIIAALTLLLAFHSQKASADAARTGFVPDVVALENVGDTVTVMIKTWQVTPHEDIGYVSLTFDYPDTFRITSIKCAGIFEGAGMMPIIKFDENFQSWRLVGAACTKNQIDSPIGEVMTLEIKKIAETVSPQAFRIAEGWLSTGPSICLLCEPIIGLGSTNMLWILPTSRSCDLRPCPPE